MASAPSRRVPDTGPPRPGNAGPAAAAPIRDAASVIVLRGPASAPMVLMGQRGSGAVFMPDKFVFPGGALDPADRSVAARAPLSPLCAERLSRDAPQGIGPALAACAIRELWEETGLVLGRPGRWDDPPPGWEGFAASGHLPDAAALRFVFRAITPAGRPRRFDARFFLARAEAIAGDPDDFSRASDELSHLHWVALSEARRLNLPFITEVVLAEVADRLAGRRADAGVPFFDNAGPEATFRRLD